MKREYLISILGALILILGVLLIVFPRLSELEDISKYLIVIGLSVLFYCIYIVPKNEGILFDVMYKYPYKNIPSKQIKSRREVISNIQDLIAKNKTEESIYILKKYLADNNIHYNSICLISGKFAELKLRKTLGLASVSALDRETTKINHSILQLLDLLNTS